MPAHHTHARAPAPPPRAARILATQVTLDAGTAVALDDVLQFLEGEGFEGTPDAAVAAMVRAHAAALDVFAAVPEDHAAMVFLAVHGAPLSESCAFEMLGRLVHATTGDAGWLEAWDERAELEEGEASRGGAEEVV